MLSDNTEIKKGKFGSSHQSNQSCMREGREMGLMVLETPSVMTEGIYMLGLWVLVKCVCAFASFELVFSSILDQSQNCEDGLIPCSSP